MALLNWGNALSQAGKGLATVGLEGVKATLEQDKIRLAAKLAAEEGILSDERKAKSATELEILRGETAATAATALADATTARDTAAFDRSVITADKLAKASKELALAQVKARNEGPEAVAALMNAQGAKALSEFNMANLEAQKILQTELMAVEGTDEKANEQRLEIKSRISAQSATAATIAVDKTGATALLATTGAELSRATQARYKAASDYADPTNADAKAALAAAVETEQYAKSNYIAAVNNAKVNIPGFKPPPVPTAVPDPADTTAAPAPGKAAAATGKAADATLMIDGRTFKVIQTPLQKVGAVGAEVGKGLLSTVETVTDASKAGDTYKRRTNAEAAVKNLEKNFKDGKVSSDFLDQLEKINAFPDLVEKSEVVQKLTAFAAGKPKTPTTPKTTDNPSDPMNLRGQ